MSTDTNTYRYEIKYALNAYDDLKLSSVIAQHPAHFTKAFPDRIVNNIYFDNINFLFCQENLDGISERTKVRYRWYNNIENFSNGQLELKIKKNALGTKEFYTLDNPKNILTLSDEVRKTLHNPRLMPSLYNRYSRSYYIDRSGKFRLTVDNKLGFNLPNLYTQKSIFEDSRIIVEVKFDQKNTSTIDSITKFLPFRLSKHSKYASGLINLVS